MNCKKCGKEMPNGARFCISCGAEHDSNGLLISKKQAVDYNKTVMASDIPPQNGNAQNIDYNKTVMDSSFSRPKVDYNKTVMANDLPSNNGVDYNKTVMATDIPNNNNYKNDAVHKSNVSTKTKRPNILVLLVTLIVIIIAFVFFIIKHNKNKSSTIEESHVEETTVTGNIVSDFDSSGGYWSKDAEYFYRDGSIQKNQWIGDYYLGDTGRKVRNSLIDDMYYVDSNGKRVKNQWYKFTKPINGINTTVWYYLGEDGAKLIDTLTPDGYYVDKDGIYIPGAETEHISPDSDRYVPENN